ncbi:MAG: TetR/AcrR family transcriptional regulator [Erysipelotrichaceae bacterium]|nr:TetR/AcrR family transcriptional regulator [Erysipelotrichaceae bacterium]
MARNKHPEKTIEFILETSKKLFLTVGYENTTIQDILNHLEGLSKGAIYHHFKSKEAIFEALSMKEAQKNSEIFLKIKNDKNMNGAQKLKEIIKFNISSENTKNIIKLCPNFLENPKFLSDQFKQMNEIIVPNFIYPIIEEGIKDGSITTDKPHELSESIMLFINIWINPLIYNDSIEKISNKLEMINGFLQKYNLVLFDEQMKTDLLKLKKSNL